MPNYTLEYVYYDKETSYYYLNSRYYNPQNTRFQIADDITYLGITGTVNSYNLFSYCEAEPVNLIDSEGYYSKEFLYKYSWLFKLASIVGMNISDKKLELPITHTFFSLNLRLFKIDLSISIGLAINYNAGISLNYTKDSLGVSLNNSLGNGYSICFAYTLTWTKIIRSISIVFCSENIGLYISLNLEFEINHIVTAALALACVYIPQFTPVLKQLVIKSNSSSVSAGVMIFNTLKFACGF